jgi:DNA-binding MarR family transcriptional regulator
MVRWPNELTTLCWVNERIVSSDPVEAVRGLARASRFLERSSGELNLAHYRVLSAIGSGDQRASRIAVKLAIGKPTVSATVEALCQRGLLVRSGVQGDQRAAALQLTPEGELMLARVEAAMSERITRLCDRTPEPAQAMQALAWLGAAIEATVAEARTRAAP